MTRRVLMALPLCVMARADTGLRWVALRVSGELIGASWPHMEQAVSLGSLLKPFLALAFLATHEHPPVVNCRGASAGCWLPGGHGRQNIVSALANSCNVYFLQLAADIDRAALDVTCLSYALTPPERGWSAQRLIGLDEGWPQSPIAAARAFAGLARNRFDRHVSVALAGMRECARSGTARLIGLPSFAKTGTARCSHLQGEHVDGYVAAIYPEDAPREIVLAMRHSSTGAHTAAAVRTLVLQCE